ncbi:MAG: hypothetical protein AAFO97_09535 [Pseudomonadota bacterium]
MWTVRGLCLLALLPLPAMAQDRITCAVNAGRNISVQQIVLNCGLSAAESAVFEAYLKQIEAGQDQMLVNQQAMQDTQRLILQQLEQTSQFQAMQAAGVTQDALIALAQRVSEDVADPGQAFAELKRAVDIAIRVQTSAVDNPSTDDFVAEVERRAAELAKSDPIAANAAAMEGLDALRRKRAEDQEREIELTGIVYQHNMATGDADSAAARLVEILDLTEGRPATTLDILPMSTNAVERALNEGSLLHLRLAIALGDIAIERAATDQDKTDAWHEQGIHFQLLANRLTGPEATEMFARSIAAYETSLQYVSKEDTPFLWATTKANIAINLVSQTRRIADEDDVRNMLLAALDNYQAALPMIDQDTYPAEWLNTQTSLGVTLLELGHRRGETNSLPEIDQAIQAFSVALSFAETLDDPVEVANQQIHLASALKNRAEAESVDALRAVFSEVERLYLAAGETYAANGIQDDWARIQHNLALLYGDMAVYTYNADGYRLLEFSMNAYDNALGFFTRDTAPYQFGTTQLNKAMTLRFFAFPDFRENRRHYFQQALIETDKALTVFDATHTPVDFQSADNLRQTLLAELDKLD